MVKECAVEHSMFLGNGWIGRTVEELREHHFFFCDSTLRVSPRINIIVGVKHGLRHAFSVGDFCQNREPPGAKIVLSAMPTGQVGPYSASHSQFDNG